MTSTANDELSDFVENNPDLLGRVLANGTPEARALALTAIVHGGTPHDVDAVIEELRQIKREMVADGADE